jgi:hypothetical protein
MSLLIDWTEERLSELVAISTIERQSEKNYKNYRISKNCWTTKKDIHIIELSEEEEETERQKHRNDNVPN